ncbi:MAG: hypothetical protein V1927_06975 [Candidatus Omnitrophota bacterium]
MKKLLILACACLLALGITGISFASILDEDENDIVKRHKEWIERVLAGQRYDEANRIVAVHKVPAIRDGQEEIVKVPEEPEPFTPLAQSSDEKPDRGMKIFGFDPATGMVGDLGYIDPKTGKIGDGGAVSECGATMPAELLNDPQDLTYAKMVDKESLIGPEVVKLPTSLQLMDPAAVIEPQIGMEIGPEIAKIADHQVMDLFERSFREEPPLLVDINLNELLQRKDVENKICAQFSCEVTIQRTLAGAEDEALSGLFPQSME